MTPHPRQPKQKAETFVKAPPWLYRPGFTDNERCAYLALREHHRENGQGMGAVPGEKRVADIIGVSRSTAKRAIRGLRAKGAIGVTLRPGTSNHYAFPDVLQPLTRVTLDDPTPDLTRVTQDDPTSELDPGHLGDPSTRVTADDPTPGSPRVVHEVETREADTTPEGGGGVTLTRNARIAPAGGASQELSQRPRRG